MSCDWSESNVGLDPYTGTTAAAVAHYVDIPAQTRRALVERMDRRQYDAVVNIDNATPLAGMHYGKTRLCETVTRNWREGFSVSALRYTVGEYTVLVPLVCKNIVRTTYPLPDTQKTPTEPARPPGGASDMPGGSWGGGLIVIAAGPTPGGTFEGGSGGPGLLPPPAGEVPVFGPPTLALLPYAGGIGLVPWIRGPVAAVPESPTWLSFLAGMVLVLILAIKGSG